jgi:ABC-type bacteriocin/lantibiotic exporters, contain an N-terminal double-glycine peptidase domain
LSSIVLVWIGKKIDDVNILKFASYVIIFLSASCFIFSKISSVIFLFVGIFLMRLSGQGLSSHTATTTISRFFEKNRGRALSTGWLGLSLAEFIMPVLIVFLLTFIEWRDIWVSISIVVIFVLPVATFFLVKEVKLDTREESKKEETSKEIKQWKRIEVLKDYRFYIICMTMLAMPWIATGSFVYQSFISSSKEWGPYVIAQSFMSYSILSVITLFLSGFLIDKFSSRKLLIYMNIPLNFSTCSSLLF